MTDFRVELDGYCGPLDLLLYLVRREEVDLIDLPLAAITGQFLEFLEVLQILDLDFIGDFVVVASTLVEIKSRIVLPQEESPPEVIEQDEDPRADLVRQLLEYKRFKEVSRLLEDQAAQWQQRYPRLADDRPRTAGDPSQDLIKEVELWDLVSALSRVLRKNTEAAPTRVIYDDTPIAIYIQQIKDRLATEERVSFSSFFAGTNSRSRILGIFLAILELLRHHKYRAEQPEAYQEIWILPPAQQAVAASPESAVTDVLCDEALACESVDSPLSAPAVALAPEAGIDDPVILRLPEFPEGTKAEPPPKADTGTGP
ncbi:MAG: chromosome segregation protein ScpA [Planctomycetaceae bacterium]|nr:MAG: chromosome segregation protein ScpA [Planctomycetaceae bacterium]